MNFPQAIEFIEGFINYETQRAGVRYNTRFFHVEHFARFLEALDRPQQSFRSIHLAGTKGKGSTAAFLHSMLTAAGYRCGLYTSPHLKSYCERIQIDREPIAEDCFAAAMAEVRRAWEATANTAAGAEQQSYRTTFELLTAAAFVAFRRAGVEWAVIETGLGGRLDATNVIVPEICAITALGLEHTEILGRTIARIAAEKCGIIKPGVPVVLAEQPAAERAAIEAVAGRFCRKNRCALIRPGALATFRNDSTLFGRHQEDNLRCALAVIAKLREQGMIGIANAAIQAGIRKTCWPGRFERICERPLVILDAAHCPISFQALSAALRDFAPERVPLLVFGCKLDKEPAGNLAAIFETFPRAEVFAAPIPSPLGMAPAEICRRLAQQLPQLRTHAFDDLRGALEAAWRQAADGAPAQRALVVCGSLYHLEPARQIVPELKRAAERPGRENCIEVPALP